MTQHESNMLEQRRGDAEWRVVQAAKEHVAFNYTHTAAVLKKQVQELLAIEAEAAGKDGQG